MGADGFATDDKPWRAALLAAWEALKAGRGEQSPTAAEDATPQ
jgi:hypothetical protein